LFYVTKTNDDVVEVCHRFTMRLRKLRDRRCESCQEDALVLCL
jgi:hypothetical protein